MPVGISNTERKLLEVVAANADMYLPARGHHPSVKHFRKLMEGELSGSADGRTARYIYNRVFMRLISHNSGFLRHEQRIWSSHEDFQTVYKTMKVNGRSQAVVGRPFFKDRDALKRYFITGTNVYGSASARSPTLSQAIWNDARRDTETQRGWPGSPSCKPSFLAIWKHLEKGGYKHVGPLLAMLVAGKRTEHERTHVS